MQDDDKKPGDETSKGLGRREFFIAGGALTAGSTLLTIPALGALSGHRRRLLDADGNGTDDTQPLIAGTIATPGVIADQTRSKKPVYLAVGARPGIAAIAVADALFWTDIMLEHALFFTLLMPGKRLDLVRKRALQFNQEFNRLFRQIRQTRWTEESLPKLARLLIPSLKKFIAYKDRLRSLQEKGELQSLVWPLFFAHTSREATRFVKRLEVFAIASSPTRLQDSTEFWTLIMAEHLEFIAHLLDPQEQALVAKADAAAKQFYGAHASLASTSLATLQSMANEVIDFKTAAEKGIDAGTIKSIIDPALADHVLREAIKFSEELK
jgi:hypothetical protein